MPELAPADNQRGKREFILALALMQWISQQHSKLGFSMEQLLTTQFVQRLLRVRVPVTALPNMVGFQLNVSSNGCDWLIAGLQVHAREKSKATCARLIFNPLIEA